MNAMKTKKDIVENWLTRYTGQQLDEFGAYILLTNFDNYIDLFCKMLRTSIADRTKLKPVVVLAGHKPDL